MTAFQSPQNLRVSPVGWLLSFLEWADYLFPYSFISFIYLFFPPALTRVRCHFQPLWKSLCVFGARQLLGLCTQPEPHVYTQLTLPLSEMTRNTSTDKYSSPACSFCSLARPGGLRAVYEHLFKQFGEWSPVQSRRACNLSEAVKLWWTAEQSFPGNPFFHDTFNQTV